ncbi:8-amino-7-oxononanoate synthase [Kovacikia minuta CCNUW1]|uniref:aminotransferase class I/II-fold pyridoxal phosphate-dependent enzyme n=1 Tax=Kovacikia minuta TaxID=2931930 RepID=UPI001CCBA984|nr:8-amino-7-oxononanoate synthase [Kovacikia minuta]UBF23801.1 8-amino-7-oxononanoate synthase [Kovacikia minuta CCNUW1]
MPTDPYGWMEPALATIHRANWYRQVQSIGSRPGALVLLEGQQVINFASNDYLGLAGDDRLIQAAIAATQKYGTGSTGSRLISGHRDLHQDLERAIADLKQTEAALVFSSGYLANLGTVSALVGKRDLILADQYNHSSLKNGAILSGATILEYAHCDLENLRQLLEPRDRYRRCLILTDSVFSMDGDLCPLPELLHLAEQFDSMLLIDEAHATGVLGKTGAGCVEHFGCTGRSLIQIGTLSKALGSLGGYVAGSATLIDFLRNRSPGWIYTTGLSPADTAAALAAVAIVQQEPQRRTQLWQNVNDLKHLLDQEFSFQPSAIRHPPSVISSSSPFPNFNSKFKIQNSKFSLSHTPHPTPHTPILCLPLDNPAIAIQLARALQQSGFFAPAVRPPTVPTSRLRLTLMATHTPTHLEQFVAALKSTLQNLLP